jgi:hypothetical protein
MIKQTESQNLGRAGERWFQSILPREWIFQKPEEDIGLDGKVIIGTDHSTGGFEFAVQVKTSRNWKIKRDKIFVDGIKSDTIVFWGSRMYPTLVILYDSDKDIGYYGWVFDIITNPMVFAHPLKNAAQKTVRLEFLASKTLDKNSFEEIEKTVSNYYSRYISSLQELRKTVNLLPTINRLVTCIRNIHLSHNEDASSDNQLRMLGLLMITGHTGIIRALDDLQKKYQLEIGSRNFINYFIANYIKQVSKFIHPFEKVVFEKKNYAVALNDEERISMTPMLLDLLFNLLQILTDEKQKNRETIFTFGAEPIK